MTGKHMIPVVLSGGSGTRLWPLSREKMPKQFSELLERSLFELTVNRLRPLGQPYIVAVKTLESLTRSFGTLADVASERMIFEPLARNTAPAIALLCRVLELRGEAGEIVGVFPADHMVADDAAFMKAIHAAIGSAELGEVVTLGIQPKDAATGFGYIELPVAPKTGASEPVQAVRFREKPDLKTAQEFLASGRYVWNAGIFVFRAQTMIDHFKKLAPEVWNALAVLKADLSNLQDVYAKTPSISLDYAIMEKLSRFMCVPCDPGWSDLGSWDDVVQFSEQTGKEAVRNLAFPIEVSSSRNFAYSTSRKVISFIDIDDAVVVDTPDALLIARRGSTQKVREVVQDLKAKGRPEADEHGYEIRPWGRYEILRDSANFKSKLISVSPQSQISYQSHTRRNEHWVIVEGEVILNEKTILIRPGESVFIPAGAKHRIRNTGTVPLEFIEVQTGTYFGEDDITRYQDDYNRIEHLK